MTQATVFQTLETVFGDRFTTSPSDRDNHGRSESYFDTMPPDAVVYVRDEQDCVRLVEHCYANDMAMIPWGAGTSLEAQAAAPRGGVCVDFSQMNRVLDIDRENMLVTVEPGITRKALDHALRHTGLFFPVDPGADATLGGMASTRASGTTTVRYGSMRDNVRALRVVTAGGQVIETGTRAAKSAAGYDLTALFVGAEGTLGLITQLTLKLHPRPSAISAGRVAFDRFDAAVQTVIETIQSGLPAARIEFVDTATVDAVNAYGDLAIPRLPHLLFEFHGDTDSVTQYAQDFQALCHENGGQDCAFSNQTEDRTALWAMRHDAYYAIRALHEGARAIVTDICVPLSKLAQAVSETQHDIEQSGLQGPILGHMGDGNFHAILLVDPDHPTHLDTARALSDRMAERALALGGTCTGEHGVGLGKRKFMSAEHGAAWSVMGAIKSSLDPKGLFNPGKLVP